MLTVNLSRKILLAIILFFVFYSAEERIFAITFYNALEINPGLVHNPPIKSYIQCVDEWKFCSCRLTGKLDRQDLWDIIDTNKDGKIEKWEVENAVRNRTLTKVNLNSANYMACFFDPPDPGPYDKDECIQRFGADDCICQPRHPYGFLCYSRSAVNASLKPVYVNPKFCKPPEGTYNNGFNCKCTSNSTPLGESALSKNCYVIPESSEVDWSCVGEIRIFAGKKYKCLEKGSAGYVVRGGGCCPDKVKCNLDEDKKGRWLLTVGLSVANASLKFYTAYKGYVGMGNAANVINFISDVMHGKVFMDWMGSTIFTTEQGFLKQFKTFKTFFNLGKTQFPLLGTASMLTNYAGWIQFSFSAIKSIAGLNCHPQLMELACKVRARLCLYVGSYTKKKAFGLVRKKFQTWMCYSSQIARVINEYGLPQLYCPECHEPECDGASVDEYKHVHKTNCGCQCAYGINGSAKKPRYNGFSIDEFQRLDFSQIPVDKEILKVALGRKFIEGKYDFSQIEQMWNDVNNEINQPSELDMEGAEESTKTTAETIEDIPQPHQVPVVGKCSENFPAAGIDELPMPSGEFRLNFCVNPYQYNPDLKMPRKYYMYYWFPVSSSCRQCALNGTSPKNCQGCNGSDAVYICYGKADWLSTPHSAVVESLGLWMESGIEASGFDDCLNDINFANFYNNNYYPLKNTGSILSRLYFRQDTIGADRINSSASIVLPSSSMPDWLFILTYSLSDSGINRGEVLDHHAGVFVYKNALLNKMNEKGWICSHEECSKLIHGVTAEISPSCIKWYNFLKNNTLASIDQNCNVFPEGFNEETAGKDNKDFTKYGKEWLVVKNISALKSIGLKEGEDYFTHCPSLKKDIQFVQSGKFPEMVCPRPAKINLIQANLIYKPGKKGEFYEDLQTDEAKKRFCCVFPVNDCECQY